MKRVSHFLFFPHMILTVLPWILFYFYNKGAFECCASANLGLVTPEDDYETWLLRGTFAPQPSAFKYET